MRTLSRVHVAGLGLLVLSACGGEAPAARSAGEAPAAVTNRVDIPARVVESLGITFVEARRGRLERRVDVPGRLVVPPNAQQVIRAPVSGRVHLPPVSETKEPVTTWTEVPAGTVVAEIRGPELQEIQARLAAVQAEVRSLAIEEQAITAFNEGRKPEQRLRLFRLEEYPRYLLAAPDVAEAVMAAGITGILFRKPDECGDYL